MVFLGAAGHSFAPGSGVSGCGSGKEHKVATVGIATLTPSVADCYAPLFPENAEQARTARRLHMGGRSAVKNSLCERKKPSENTNKFGKITV